MHKHLPLLFLAIATIASCGDGVSTGEQQLALPATTAPAAATMPAATTAPTPATTAPAPSTTARAAAAVSPWVELDWFNSRPIPPDAFRVLYVGDSLTVAGAAPGLWDHDGGMAATDTAHDFLHLTAGHIQKALTPRPVEALLDNGGNGKIGTMLEYLVRRPELKPDLVILQGGENDAFDDSFRQTYLKLMEFYPVPVIVAGEWWSAAKSDWEKQQAAARKHPFVDLMAIDAIPANSGDGGPFGVEAVARHPSNAGQAAIAKGIDDAFDQFKR
jgi:hypothetical protein